MRSALAVMGSVMLAGCLLPPLDLEGLACSEQQACSGAFVCLEGRCREVIGSVSDGGSTDAGPTGADASVPNPDAGTCREWRGNNFCADFDDYQQGQGWQLSPGARLTMVTYPDPSGRTGSAQLEVNQGYAFLRSPSVSFSPQDVTSVVRATTSFVLNAGAQPMQVLALSLGNKHRLVLAYAGNGNGTLTEERPDGGRQLTHPFALPANGGSVWLQVVGDFRADGGVWLGVNQDWQNVTAPRLVAIDPSRAQASIDVGILATDGGAALLLDFAALETW